MAWRVEKHDMMAGQAHGRDLQQSLGMEERCVDGREGGRAGLQGETFLRRQRDLQQSVSLKRYLALMVFM
jgi:hypothetical protein